MENRKKSTIFRDTFALFMITLIAGICLGLVYQITKEPISRAEEAAKQKAYEKVFVNAEFERNQETDGKREEAAAYFEQKGIAGTEISEIMEAIGATGAREGCVMTVVSKEGYGGDIKISLGIKEDGSISGLEILSMSETAGLGAKCSEEEFKSQFTGKQGEIVYTKTGKTAENEIDAISGATITTKAVAETVNAVVEFAQDVVLAAAQ